MSDATDKAGRKEWVGLATLVLPCLLVSMDVGVLFFALPDIAGDLRPSATEQLWISDLYGFLLAGMLIPMGALGDRIGRRKLLLIGGAAFGLASFAASLSDSATQLIVTRALLGIAGATLMPSTLSLIRNMFLDENQRKAAIGIWTGAATSGIALGPILAGFLLEHFWWGSVFLINIPVMVLLLIVGPILLPEFKAPQPDRFDLVGAVLSLAAILLVVYGIKDATVDGFGVTSLASILGGLLVGTVFVLVQRRGKGGLIDVALFRSPAFTASVVLKLLTMFALTGITLFTNQYLQLVQGLRPFTAALWSLSVMPALFVVMSVTVALSTKVRPGYLLSAGLVLMTIGFVQLSVLRPDSGLWVVLTGAGTVAAGMMMTAPLLADMVMAAAPPERAGAASAMSETSDELGGAIGMAILGSVGAAIYHRQMSDVQVPGASSSALEAARDTLGGARAVAGQLPGQLGDGLLAAGQRAFTDGMNTAAIVAGCVMLVTAALTARLLRGLPSPAAAAVEDDAEELVAARAQT
ncbi:MFS transporter [Streptomyces sp. enrichment culture]|uniref:MFS transporter n=1 Tax=Streptomyces sp. enrichment culture TaxID=1795815 RepID=UPI003F55D435